MMREEGGAEDRERGAESVLQRRELGCRERSEFGFWIGAEEMMGLVKELGGKDVSGASSPAESGERLTF